ncbi:MAG: aminotransferase class I/II-fold pyridoxal phosphate-dependent enzyme, partial [Lewinellaceae bacterium]|nr:aminotransferase class I/II-fold pyridoxal phosphate-dependent enzyme [Lewinellaceae bacterium]
SIARFYPEGTIISSGISKWCGAGGWRLGMFVFPESLRWLLDAMAIVASETFTSTSAPIQYAAVEAFKANPIIDQYLRDARRILGVVGRALHSKLSGFNVSAPKPQGGFYLFPNFSFYKDSLVHRGILNSQQLCEQMLEDTGVALLPSYDFGRPSDELTARMSYVDFNGEKALKMAREEYPEQPLNGRFVEQICGDMMESVQLIGEWLQRS